MREIHIKTPKEQNMLAYTTDHRFRDMDHLIDWSELIGKTINSVDDKSGCNVVELGFTDGTFMEVNTEPVMQGIYTPVLCVPTNS